MSSYPFFLHFQSFPCLDNFVSGIPNAITIQSAALMTGGWERGPVFASPATPIEYAQAIKVPDSRMRAVGLKTDVEEETNVEFQRCGPQDSR
jgi:hypothetical protein